MLYRPSSSRWGQGIKWPLYMITINSILPMTSLHVNKFTADLLPKLTSPHVPWQYLVKQSKINMITTNSNLHPPNTAASSGAPDITLNILISSLQWGPRPFQSSCGYIWVTLWKLPFLWAIYDSNTWKLGHYVTSQFGFKPKDNIVVKILTYFC